METAPKIKAASKSNASSLKPFFSKSGEGSFLNRSNETATSFFGPATIQAKLDIGQPNDKYEQEADALADRVGRGEKGLIDNTSQAPNLQSKCADCSEKEGDVHQAVKEEESEEVQTKPLLMQRTQDVKEEESEEVQTKPLLMLKTQDGGGLGTTALSSQLNSSKGGGQTLPEATNQDMSQSFGTDFSHVRVHTDARASEMNEGLNARAFTHGSDIYFNNQQYNPGSSEGKKLLAHELTHTIQQGQAGEKVQKMQSNSQQLEGNTAGLSEEELVLSQAHDPLVQRSTKWTAGAVHKTVNSASTVLTGAPTPITWHMLNGTQLASHALAIGAINSPTISTYKVGPSWKAKVTAVPLNVGSFDETVLMPGPWTNVVPKATVNAKLGIAACTGAGNTTFRSKGTPSDNSVYKANRRHEDHHAKDHKTAFKDIVKAWDAKVTKAKKKATEYNGASAADAEANLWAAMGGTPAEIAVQFTDECFARGGTFHGTAKGGPMSISGKGSDPTCTNSWVKVKNPS